MNHKNILKLVVGIIILLVSIFYLTPKIRLRCLNKELVEDMQNKAEYISTYYIYGKGESLSDGLQSVIDDGKGNCSHTAYTIARYARESGVEARLVSLVAKTANHVVCEVNVDGGWMTVDASNGVFYPHSVYELLKEPSLLSDMIGTANEFSKVYTLKSFWSNIYSVKVNRFSDILKPIKATVYQSSNDFMPENGANIVTDYSDDRKYAACYAGEQTSWITLDLGNVRPVDLVAIDWYNADNYAGVCQIDGSENGEDYFSLRNTWNKTDVSTTNEMNIKPTETRYIRFTFSDFKGQPRLLIRNIKVFSDPVDWEAFFQS